MLLLTMGVMPMTDPDPILEVENLEKYFQRNQSLLKSLFGSDSKPVQAVDDVSLTLHPNESQGVIGESGCGKTTLIMTLMGLHDPTGGEIRYRGTPVSSFGRSEWLEFRRNVQMVFQDPFNSLDPKMSVREWLLEPLKIHSFDDHQRRVREVLEQVQLQPVDVYIDKLPGELSGGEKQRVSIARALVSEPEVILADEPVSMLDVSTQAAILNLLSELTDDLGVSMLYISHDLSTVSYVCDYINVMYLGRIVERAKTETLLESPKHPYAEQLMNAVPIPNPHHKRTRTSIDGAPREPVDLDSGCRFRDRCPERMEICEQKPRSVTVDDDHEVACHLYYDHGATNATGEGRNGSQPAELEEEQ